jgi:hypothetical protein
VLSPALFLAYFKIRCSLLFEYCTLQSLPKLNMHSILLLFAISTTAFGQNINVLYPRGHNVTTSAPHPTGGGAGSGPSTISQTDILTLTACPKELNCHGSPSTSVLLSKFLYLTPTIRTNCYMDEHRRTTALFCKHYLHMCPSYNSFKCDDEHRPYRSESNHNTSSVS